jgi:hypothetical protein
MSCNYKKNLSAYLDEELSDKQRDKVQSHLYSCSGCQDRLRQLREIRNLSKPLLNLEVPYYLTSKTINFIRDEGNEARFYSWVKSLPRLPNLNKVVITFLIAILVILGSYSFNNIAPLKKLRIHDLSKQTESDIVNKGEQSIDFDLIAYLFSSNKLVFEGEAPLIDLGISDNRNTETRKVFDSITFYQDKSKQPIVETHYDW